jgi:hypothetical protein
MGQSRFRKGFKAMISHRFPLYLLMLVRYQMKEVL